MTVECRLASNWEMIADVPVFPFSGAGWGGRVLPTRHKSAAVRERRCQRRRKAQVLAVHRRGGQGGHGGRDGARVAHKGVLKGRSKTWGIADSFDRTGDATYSSEMKDSLFIGLEFCTIMDVHYWT